jgi:hypothetical protein
MKRFVFGTHHSISEAHLHRYLVEWNFKFNNRNASDDGCAVEVLKYVESKRLTNRRTDNAAHAQTKK